MGSLGAVAWRGEHIGPEPVAAMNIAGIRAKCDDFGGCGEKVSSHRTGLVPTLANA
jgi:hypothetical protein